MQIAEINNQKNMSSDNERFEQAVAIVLTHEGGYSNDSNDRGGETKYGISKRSYPDLDIASLTKETAKSIYRKDFWEKQHYKDIKDIALTTKIFDIAINIGPRRANRIIQGILIAMGKNIVKDDILGPLSLAAINSSDPLALIMALKSEVAKYYINLATNHQSQKKFINGWLNRAYA